MNDDLEAISRRYEQAADELELAARHLRTSARHVRSREGARTGAHAFAAYGHLRRTMAALDELADRHATRARPE